MLITSNETSKNKRKCAGGSERGKERTRELGGIRQQGRGGGREVANEKGKQGVGERMVEAVNFSWGDVHLKKL